MTVSQRNRGLPRKIGVPLAKGKIVFYKKFRVSKIDMHSSPKLPSSC